MDQEQINVIQLKFLQGVVDGPSDVLWCVEVLPHLGSDKELFALNFWVVAQEFLDAGSDLILVQVEPGAIKVTVAGLKSGDDSAVCLPWGADADRKSTRLNSSHWE